jgi:hypothetical protein
MTKLIVAFHNFAKAPKNRLAIITAIYSLLFSTDWNKVTPVLSVCVPLQHVTTLDNAI